MDLEKVFVKICLISYYWRIRNFYRIMDGDTIAESYGCMTADWLNEQLADFMYTFENDSDGMFIAKGSFTFHHFAV